MRTNVRDTLAISRQLRQGWSYTTGAHAIRKNCKSSMFNSKGYPRESRSAKTWPTGSPWNNRGNQLQMPPIGTLAQISGWCHFEPFTCSCHPRTLQTHSSLTFTLSWWLSICFISLLDLIHGLPSAERSLERRNSVDVEITPRLLGGFFLGGIS